jgi:hypothetical protein
MEKVSQLTCENELLKSKIQKLEASFKTMEAQKMDIPGRRKSL